MDCDATFPGCSRRQERYGTQTAKQISYRVMSGFRWLYPQEQAATSAASLHQFIDSYAYYGCIWQWYLLLKLWLFSFWFIVINIISFFLQSNEINASLIIRISTVNSFKQSCDILECVHFSFGVARSCCATTLSDYALDILIWF